MIRGERSNHFPKSGNILLASIFLFELIFTQKYFYSAIADCSQSFLLPHPKLTIRLPVLKIMKERKEEKWGKMNIGVGYFVTAKIGETDNTKEV